MEKHPKFLKDQIAQEIKLSMDSFVPVGLMTLPWFLGDVKGYSQLYLENGPNIGSIPYIRSLPAGLRTVLGLADGGNGGKIGAGLYILISAMGFILFTDYTIYWVHRMLHHPLLYKRLHKPHHRFISEFKTLQLDSSFLLYCFKTDKLFFFTQFQLHSHHMHSTL